MQLKITCRTNNQENLNSNEKRHATEANNEIIKMLKLSDNTFKATIIKIYQKAISSTPETNEKKKIASAKKQKI